MSSRAAARALPPQPSRKRERAAEIRERAPRLDREARVGEILRAARDMFCGKGYESTTVAEIAARMGLVEGNVYKYFASKRELLLRVLEHWYEEMFSHYTRELAEARGARERLRLLIARHLRSIHDHPLLCRLMFREVRSEADYHGSKLHELNRRYTQLLLDVIEQGAAAGEFRADTPAPLLRDVVYGGIEHHSWNYICGRGGLDVSRIADAMTALLCEGLAPRRPAAGALHAAAP